MRPSTVVSLWEMQKLLVGDIRSAHANLSMLADRLVEAEHSIRHDADMYSFAGDHFALLRVSASNINHTAVALSLPASRKTSGELMKLISLVPEVGGFYKLNWNTIVAIRATCGSLILSFPAEMEDRLVFSIASRDATLINSDTPPFGNRVADAFPLAAEDIVEAAMCLGLSRFTASAFHLMRALEGSLQQLGKHLSLASVDIEWGKLISAITTAVETMPKGEDRNRWSENLSLLYHVKQAWRNDTMHPKKTYTEEEAHGLFQATKSFMHHLALLVSS